MVEILVTSKKYGSTVTLIDITDFDLISKYKWSLKKYNGTSYPRCNIWVNGKRKTMFMHKLLCPDFEIVDHINGNGLDNRRSNLRKATKRENNRNTKKSKAGTTSIYKGVCRYTGSSINNWMGYITVNYKRIYLGLFKTPEEAALAYNEAAIEYFGEFASLNILNNS